ncbi:protein kinase [Clostridium sp. C8-1-8]|uniref:protein kinase n=1 Tax=Clostridium sp. C8-1-8 TaxID=2698831 RepID=UPI00136E8386|nr:protein kinase [Clostridium sp. C8-1-8]
MVRNWDYSVDFTEEIENQFKHSEYLGEGHNGIVYSLPDNKIIKIFREKKVCDEEIDILLRVKGSKFFPYIHSCGELYIIRDYVGGERLDKYIKDNGLNGEICKSLLDMINEFTRLSFTRIDIRCKDIYVQEDMSVVIIDPKNNYTKTVRYPRHLMKGLYNLNALDVFFKYLSELDRQKYILWKYKMGKYIKFSIK